MMANLEIERKFLIRYPDISLLTGLAGVRVLQIVQTYLASKNGETSRVRKIVSDGVTSYIYTSKIRVTNITHIENERKITREEYEELLLQADSERKPICKTRYCVPNGKHVAEIDVYDFWNDRATLEIELSSEDEEFEMPDFISVIKEVTDDRRYKNASLSKSVVYEEL